MTAPVLLWLRRELRLADNRALAAALATGRQVLPVFVLDEVTPGAWAPGGASRWWLHMSLASLAADLRRAGAPLVLKRGPIGEILPRLAHQTGACEIHAGQPVEPWARRAVAEVQRAIPGGLHLHRTATLFDPDEIRTQAGGAYGVYTPFARACLARLPAGAAAARARLHPRPRATGLRPAGGLGPAAGATGLGRRPAGDLDARRGRRGGAAGGVHRRRPRRLRRGARPARPRRHLDAVAASAFRRDLGRPALARGWRGGRRPGTRDTSSTKCCGANSPCTCCGTTLPCPSAAAAGIRAHAVAARRRRPARLAARPHRHADRRCRHAPALADRLDA